MSNIPLTPPPMFSNGKKIESTEIDNSNTPPVTEVFTIADIAEANKPSSELEPLPEDETLSLNDEEVEPVTEKKTRASVFGRKKNKKEKDEEVDEVVITSEPLSEVKTDENNSSADGKTFDELLAPSDNEKELDEESSLTDNVPNSNRKPGMWLFGGLTLVLLGAAGYYFAVYSNMI